MNRQSTETWSAIGFKDCLARVWPRARVVFEESDADRVLERPYAQVDRKKLKRTLLETCLQNRAQLVRGKVHDVLHEQEKSVVQCSDNRK